jgi:non-haem Fe2+, alpha-ketoglutarate-dependent halogenase
MEAMRVGESETAARFRADGYVSPIRVLDDQQAAAARSEFDEMERRLGGKWTPNEQWSADLEFASEFIWKVATQDRLLDVVEEIIGPDILLLNISRFFCRYGPDAQAHTDWHQDVTYLRLKPPELVTAWYAIDDVDEKNGGLGMVCGSYVHGIRPHGQAQRPGNFSTRGDSSIELSEEDERNIDRIALRSGEACLFSGLTVHGSGANLTPRRRAGLACRYINPRVIASEGSLVTAAALVRGRDDFHNYSVLPGLPG